MSTHNIGFYEDLTKIIFELSLNIIKYAPYFFCWSHKTIIVFQSLITLFIHVSSNSKICCLAIHRGYYMSSQFIQRFMRFIKQALGEFDKFHIK